MQGKMKEKNIKGWRNEMMGVNEQKKWERLQK